MLYGGYGAEPVVSRSCLDCGAIISRGPRCAPCESKRNVARGSSSRRGYGYHHRTLSERYRRRNRLCELRYPGCLFLAVDADHKLPLRAGGRNEWSNTRCASPATPARPEKTPRGTPMPPSCTYCERPYGDPRGCEYLDRDERP